VAGWAGRWSGWAVTRASAGRRAYQVPASDPAAAVHLTTVVRLPAAIAEALAPALERLRALGPAHHWYPPEAMHVTVQNLDGLAPPHGELVAALVAAQPSFRLTLRGLGHANLARFSGPVTTGFLPELARMGGQGFGSFTVEEVELVRTDRLLSPAGTTTLARIRLAGRPG
jgi:hypothetical protein